MGADTKAKMMSLDLMAVPLEARQRPCAQGRKVDVDGVALAHLPEPIHGVGQNLGHRFALNQIKGDDVVRK